MKTRIHSPAVIVLSALIPLGAAAQLLVYEGFTEGTGNPLLAGYAGTSEIGLSGTWTHHSGQSMTIRDGSGGHWGAPQPYWPAIEHTAWSLTRATRPMTTAIDFTVDGTYYMSYFIASDQADHGSQVGFLNAAGTLELMAGNGYSGAANKGITAYLGSIGGSIQQNCNGTFIDGDWRGQMRQYQVVVRLTRSNANLTVDISYYRGSYTNNPAPVTTRTVDLGPVTDRFNVLQIKADGWVNVDEIRIGLRPQDVGLPPADPMGVTRPVMVPDLTPIYRGTVVTLSVEAYGEGPLQYTWQTDNGTGGTSWTDVPHARANVYTLDTTSVSEGTYQYRVIVANNIASVTSSVATVTVAPPSAPVLVTDTRITPAAVFAGSRVEMRAVFNGTMPIQYQWMCDDGKGVVPVGGATNEVHTILSAQIAHSGKYFLVASNRVAPYLLASSPAPLIVAPPPQTNTVSAGIFDAGSSPPTPGPYDIAQLTDMAPTTVAGINYYVDNADPPGQSFTTSEASAAGYRLEAIYVKSELSTAGGGGLQSQRYTLNIYSVIDTNAVLITSYVSTNMLAITEGHWLCWLGLTNVLEPGKTYGFAIRNSSGWWKLANTQNFMDPNNPLNDMYPEGRIALFPRGGVGGMLFGTDPFIDAAFVIQLAPLGAGAGFTNAPELAFTVSRGMLVLEWPRTHTGWALETNAAGPAVRGAWYEYPADSGSRQTNRVAVPIRSDLTNVFFRLRAP